MKDFFLDKLEYNYDSNRKLIDLITNNPHGYSNRTQSLIGHTLNAQNIWNHRILGAIPTQKVWDVFAVNELAALNYENHEKSASIIKTLALKELIYYTDSQGDRYSNTVEQIVYHIINHGTYHRGQLVTELKSHGVAPVSTDFIFYHR